MDNADIDRFLAQLSPAQETVVLLREIRDLLKPLHDAEVKRVSDAEARRKQEEMAVKIAEANYNAQQAAINTGKQGKKR